MAPTIPTGEPTTVTAGSTWTWKLSHTTYPVSEGWALSYAINGVGKLAWSASYVASSGTDHTVTIPAANTADLPPGTYEFFRVWTGSGGTAGQVYTEALPRLAVLANPQTAGAGDRQSWEEKTLAVIETVLSGRITDDIAMYQIGGRTVSKIPFNELVAMRAALRQAVQFQRTGTLGQRIAYSFTAPAGSAF